MTLKEIVWLIACVLSAAYLVFYIILVAVRKKAAARAAPGFDFAPAEDPGGNTVVPVKNERRRPDSSVSFSSGNMTAALAISIGGRQSQQDCVSVSPASLEDGSGIYAVLCDGMGGLAGGEKASSLTTEILSTALSAAQPFSALYGTICAAMKNANERISSLCDETGRRLNCGTTALAAVVANNELVWCSAGDSRIYLFRGGALYQLTTDQVFMIKLMDEVNAGTMTLQEALIHPKRDALISYIGSGEHLVIDRDPTPVSLISGDIVLLASDGLYKSMTKQDISAVLFSRGTNVENAAIELVETAIEHGGRRQDNTTVAIIRIN